MEPDADYVHICYNNTIYGTKFNYIPDTGDIPLVADMSSCIISHIFVNSTSVFAVEPDALTNIVTALAVTVIGVGYGFWLLRKELKGQD